MKVFVNYTNHPSEKWDLKQIEVSREYGEIIDVPFPVVDAAMNEEEIDCLAQEEVKRILDYHPSIVLCQGEFTLCFRIVQLLKEAKIPVIAACSKRNVIEENGKKLSVFEFVRYRAY